LRWVLGAGPQLRPVNFVLSVRLLRRGPEDARGTWSSFLSLEWMGGAAVPAGCASWSLRLSGLSPTARLAAMHKGPRDGHLRAHMNGWPRTLERLAWYRQNRSAL